jgi:hypothetical protein
MAEAFLTLPNLVKINDRNLADLDVPNFLNSAPAVRMLAATIASQDTLHKFLQYANPTAGFRTENDGREVQVSVDTLVTAVLTILDASFRTDLSLADGYKDGRDAWVNREGARHLDEAFFKVEQQIFQGTNSDPLGFDGFPDHATMDAAADAMVVDAGGAGVALQQSAYVVRSGPMDVEMILGRNGNIAIEPSSIQETAGTTGTFPAIYTPITAWYGLKIGSTVTSVVRIANIEPGTVELTDDLIYEAIGKFGAGRQPTHIFVHRTGLESLRKGRTATNTPGDPAPRPMFIEGIPVIPTDGISTTEAVLA